jgi:hypothetical protein
MQEPISYFVLGGSAEVRITFELVVIYIRKLKIMWWPLCFKND